MERDRGLTIHFMDGTSLSFDFPEQAPNEVARKLLIEEMARSPYLMISADGALLMFPVANIKSIQLTGPSDGSAAVELPAHVIRGATIVG